jgi:uncharacterized membrane protein YcaP (DUF421 family)
MFNLSLPWWEFVVRGVVVYFAMLILLRLGGRKQVGQMSPFDFVLLLVLSNAVQNSMNGGDNSLTGGLIIAVALVAANWLMGFMTFRSKKISGLLEGKPEILIHNGKIFEDMLMKEKITHEELRSTLRKNGFSDLQQVKYAVLETTGEISVIGKT